MKVRYDKISSCGRILIQALRNLVAQKRRTIAVVVSLACGISALCIIGGYYEYSYWGLAQSLIRSDYGHIKLYQRGYLNERDIEPFSHPIKDAERLLALLKADPEIETAAARARAFGSVRNPATGATAVVEIRGVVPEDESGIFTFVTSKRGSLLSSNDAGYCQIAPTLAKKLGAGIDDTLLLSVIDADTNHNAAPTKIKTMIGSYTADFDSLALTVTRSFFSSLFGFEGILEIAVLLKDGVDVERKLAELRRSLNEAGFDLEYRLWYDEAEYFKQVLGYFQGFYHIVLVMAAVLAFFVCSSTIGISLNERMREFGIRIGVGESRGRIVASLVVESIASGAVGLVCGALISFMLASTLNALGGIPMGQAPGMAAALKVMIRYSPQAALLSTLVSLVVPPAALAGPARRLVGTSIVGLLEKRPR